MHQRHAVLTLSESAQLPGAWAETFILQDSKLPLYLGVDRHNRDEKNKQGKTNETPQCELNR